MSTDNHSSLARSTLVISTATVVSRVTGFIAIVVIAYALGYNRLSDSYNLANTMPNMLFELVMGGILTSLFIPLFIDYLVKDKDEAWVMASNITNISVSLLVVIATLGTIFSYYFVRLQTFLVSPEAASPQLASFFFKYFVWEIVFYGFCAILNGVLQSFRRFTAPAVAPIFNNLITIITVLLVYLPLHRSHPHLALIGLAAGTTLGVVSMAVVQFPSLFKVGYKHHWVFNLRHPAVKTLAGLSLPILGYVASNQIGLTISNALAWQFKGGMTAFTIAWRFFQLPYGVFAVAIATALFPSISEKASLEDMDGFKRYLSLGIRTTGFIILPASILIFILAKPIIIVPLRHVNFSLAGAKQTAGVLAYFALGLFPFSTYIFLTRLFYALKDTITPMKVNAVAVVLNIIADIILVKFFGVKGLSMGHTIAYLFAMSLLLIFLRVRIGGLNGRLIVVRLAKFSFISVISGLTVIIFLKTIAPIGDSFSANLINLLVGFILAVIVYLGLNYLLKTEEINFVGRLARSHPEGNS